MDHLNKIKVPDPVLKGVLSKKKLKNQNTIKKRKADSKVGTLMQILKTQYFKRHGLSSSGSYKE